MRFQPKNESTLKRLFLFSILTAVLSVALSGCTDSTEIQMVKGGQLGNCPDATVEEMVDSFLGNPSWQSGTSDDGVTFVNIEGDLTVYEKEVRGAIQFIVNAGAGSFEFNAFELNGVPQPNIMAMGLLTKMCEATQ